MRFSLKICAAVLTVAGVSMTLVSGPAFAVKYWAAPATPLAAKTDGVTQGRAYGYHEIDQTSSGTRSHAETRIYDNKEGGDSIYIELHTYVNAGLCFAPDYTSCNQPYYYYYDKDQSSHWSDNSWSPYFWSLGTTAVPASGDYARGSVKVCEDQNNAPDDCSGFGHSKGTQY